MKLYELGRYNIPEKIIDAWIDQVGEDLLLVEERAINRYRFLEGNSLIISRPTSSRKTFVGEIAAVKGVTNSCITRAASTGESFNREEYL